MDQLLSEIKSAAAAQSHNVYNTYSPLWASLLAKRDGIAESSLRNFLRSNQASGVAGHSTDPALFAAFYESLIDDALIAEHPLPSIGNPVTIKFRNRQASVSHLENLAVYAVLKDMHRPSGDGLEIGAGYGCMASFLLRTGRVRSYTIIDLPENLINSAYFLSKNFPQLKVTVAQSPTSQDGIVLVPPGLIDSIDSFRFDFAINTDSLGEMQARTAIAYVSWIHDHLRPGGFFFSKNGHRRGNADGVRRVSEYGYQRFRLHSLQPAIAASSIFDDFSHFALLEKGGHMSTEQIERLDTLADLYALGLHKELIGISNHLVDNTLTADDEAFLTFASRYFRGESTAYTGEHDACANFMRGFYRGVQHRSCTKELSTYLQHTKSFAAEVYANLLTGMRTEINGAATRYFLTEVQAIREMPPVLRTVVYRIRLDNLRKKISLQWQPSMLTRAKNLALNLTEGRFAISR